MKTSNKILVGLFVFVFGAYALINGMLYAKIKKGVYVTREQYESSNSNMIKTGAFTKIELLNCGGVSLMKSDSFYLSVDKGNDGKYSYKVEGDKLIIKSVEPESNGKGYISLRIMSHPVSEIVLNNSDLYIHNFSTPALSLHASRNSYLMIFSGTIDSLKLTTENSAHAEISDESIINVMDLSLGGVSSFNPNMAKISRIRASYISDSARVELGGKNLKAFGDATANK